MPRSIGRTGERAFNGALSTALCEVVSHWQEKLNVWTENTQVVSGGDGKTPDILIDDSHTPPVIIEPSYDPKDADKDALARLGVTTNRTNATIKTAIAVHSPEWAKTTAQADITKKLLEGEDLLYSLHQVHGKGRRRFPEAGYIIGGVADLAALVMNAALPKADLEAVGTAVAQNIDQVGTILDGAIDEPKMESLMESSYQRSPLSQIRAVAILWLNALLTQARLHEQNPHAAPGLPLFAGDVLPGEIAKSWKAILDQNWRAIYEPAIGALEGAYAFSPRATARALSVLLAAVQRIESAAIGRSINVGAELFPKITEDRKQSAAFYTQAGTADLLAALAIQEDMLPAERWADPGLFEDFRIADLACGTGTLLRFAYQRVRAFHEKHAGEQSDTRTLHQHAMERGIIGTDISPIATHLASSSLAAIGGGEPYGETQIGWVDVGSPNGKTTTGSLEYMNKDAIHDLFSESFGRSIGTEGKAPKTNSIVVKKSSLDIVVMNPPYSRTRGGQSAFDVAGLSDRDRSECQKRWGRLVKNKPCSNQAGMAASFLVIGSEKVKVGGRLAFVLPQTAAFAGEWKETRAMIESEFEDLIALVVRPGRALAKDAFSADTKMEEMLLVGTKKETQDGTVSSIYCVVLDSPPTRPGEATEIARAVLRAVGGLSDGVHQTGLPVTVGSGHARVGGVIRFRPDEGEPWSPLGVVNEDLSAAAEALKEGVIVGNGGHKLPVPMTTLGELFSVGPTHHLIGHLVGNDPIGAFQFHELGDGSARGSNLSLWAADSVEQIRLKVKPTHKGYGPVGVGSPEKRKEMKSWASTLFYARNMRWTSQKLLAATTERKAMGGRAWASLLHNSNPVIHKAFALWANSTFGMVLHWTKGQRTQAGRSTLQIKALQSMPCPDLSRLSEKALKRAARAFDTMADTEVLNRAMLSQSDRVRHAIDSAVIRMFGLPVETEDTAADLREWWCAEPSVNGGRLSSVKDAWKTPIDEVELPEAAEGTKTYMGKKIKVD